MFCLLPFSMTDVLFVVFSQADVLFVVFSLTDVLLVVFSLTDVLFVAFLVTDVLFVAFSLTDILLCVFSCCRPEHSGDYCCLVYNSPQSGCFTDWCSIVVQPSPRRGEVKVECNLKGWGFVEEKD